MLRRATIVVWLVLTAVAGLYCAVTCFFAIPQFAPYGIAGTNCLGGSKNEEQHRQELKECEESTNRQILQFERRLCIQRMLVFGSMVVVSAVVIRRERKRAAV